MARRIYGCLVVCDGKSPPVLHFYWQAVWRISEA
jgi:hypothetical protein